MGFIQLLLFSHQKYLVIPVRYSRPSLYWWECCQQISWLHSWSLHKGHLIKNDNKIIFNPKNDCWETQPNTSLWVKLYIHMVPSCLHDVLSAFRKIRWKEDEENWHILIFPISLYNNNGFIITFSYRMKIWGYWGYCTLKNIFQDHKLIVSQRGGENTEKCWGAAFIHFHHYFWNIIGNQKFR